MREPALHVAIAVSRTGAALGLVEFLGADGPVELSPENATADRNKQQHFLSAIAAGENRARTHQRLFTSKTIN